MFERAIELDAGYGPAWAGLATVHATLYEWFGATRRRPGRAERASQRALELAPDLAEAHVARGCRAVAVRRYDEAARGIRGRHPRSIPICSTRTTTTREPASRAARSQRSAELFRKAADVRQDDFQSPMLLGQSLRMLGRTRRRRWQRREKGSVAPSTSWRSTPWTAGRCRSARGALLEDGQRARALEWSQRSLELYPDDMGTLVNAACLRARLGQKEEALDLLERVFARGWGKRDWVEHDPDYDILRDDPRFKKLLARLK